MAVVTRLIRPRSDLQAELRGTWRTYDATDGLPAGVWSLAEDAAGYLWLGTRAGLSRYDGCRFETWTTVDGLVGNEVMALCAGPGEIWVGTREGLSIFDGRQFRNIGLAEGLPSAEIEHIARCPRGWWWVATRRGLACWDGQRWRVLTADDGLPASDVRQIHPDAAGRLWLATTRGLCCWQDGDLRTWTHREGLPGNHVLSIAGDPAGRLWVGTLTGLAYLEHGTVHQVPVGEGASVVNFRAIQPARDGRVWFGSVGQGLYCWDGDRITGYGIRDGLLGEHVTSLAEDSEGHLWIGDGMSGLTCWHGETIEPICDEPVTESLCADQQGRLWFASGDELCCWDRGVLERRRFDGRLFGLLVDRANRLWVATWGEGVYCLDLSAGDGLPGQPRQYTTADGLPSNFAAGLCETAAGELWVGSAQPGCLCHLVAEHFEVVDLPLRVVFRIFESQDGALWAAGFSGGGLVSYDGRQVRHYQLDDGLPSDAVQSVGQDEAGTVWAGTRQGVCRWQGERFEVLGKDAGFLTLDNQVAARAADGSLWFGTKCGAYRWHHGHLQVLTTEDGLPGNSITALLPEASGSLVVGTFHGVVRYRPTARRPPRIAVREMTADQVYRDPLAVTVPRSAATLVTFTFRSLSLGTRRMRYSYRLLGYQEEWQETWEATVRYERLPVGEYRFQVLAINRDLVLSEQPAEVALTVSVDPWVEERAEFEAEIDNLQQRLALEQRASRQTRALVALAHDTALQSGRVSTALERAVSVALETLAVDCVVVWRLEEGYDLGPGLRGDAQGVGGPGRLLALQRCPLLREVLEGSRALAVDQLAGDPRLAELGPELHQERVAAVLLAPVRSAGRVTALLSCESLQPRRWSVDEQQFAASLADLLALALEAHDRRLAEGRVRFQAQLLEQVSDAVVATDAAGRVTYWNRAAEELLGWAEPAQEALTLAALLPGSQLDEQLGGDDNTRLGEAMLRLPDGREVAVEWALTPLAAVAGHEPGAVVVVRDVSERKRAEAEQHILQLQVQHAQKLESLGVLAGGIAHDFNNLLMGMLGNAGLALMELPPESPARPSVEQIELASQRAAELTRQMLAYSGRGHFEVRPLNLATLVREMAHLLEVSISKKAVLRYEFGADLPAVEADATQMRQVVMNLITNASDALGDQPGVISIRTGVVWADQPVLREAYLHDELPEGRYVFVEVSDTGSGMDEETRERIFEPFFTTKFTGRGLGLAAVLGIVRGHRGAISVHSRPDHGTTFRVLLPAGAAPTVEPPSQELAAAACGGNATILVVDDEEAVRSVVSRSLEQFGYRVLLAVDGVEGVRLFAERQAEIDLVVMDMTMPRLDGAEACRQLRAIRADVPVVLSSGHHESEALQRFEGLAVAGFLQKPYGPKRLLEKVREVLTADQPEPPGPAA
ncbi:MAG: response regulator [Fimbriimonadaceae bacterium]|nr:response regulator [Fimbriimonadaceae bacterium]